jgi:hypothetical protein
MMEVVSSQQTNSEVVHDTKEGQILYLYTRSKPARPSDRVLRNLSTMKVSVSELEPWSKNNLYIQMSRINRNGSPILNPEL